MMREGGHGRSACTCLLPWLLLLLAAASPAAASNATMVVGTGVGANFPSFPFIRCSDYRCSNSPYFLTRPTLSALNSRQLLVCTTLRTRSAQGCMPGQDPTSCSALANSLHALYISTSPRCAPAISNVLLDNANQGFSVQAVNGTQQAVLQVKGVWGERGHWAGQGSAAAGGAAATAASWVWAGAAARSRRSSSSGV
ncbi:hypothetical protein V8C86DRAFT_2879335, partial [Haematococcus lacustris]